MFENPRRGRQARNFTTNVPKILDLKSSSEQIFFRKLSLGAPRVTRCKSSLEVLRLPRMSSLLEKFKKGIFRGVYILRVPHQSVKGSAFSERFLLFYKKINSAT